MATVAHSSLTPYNETGRDFFKNEPSEPKQDRLSEMSMASKVREMFQVARDERRPLVERWNRNYRMLFNRYYDHAHRAPWKVAAEIPEIYPIVASLVGWMTDQRVKYDVAASSEFSSQHYTYYDQIADDLEILLNTSWSVNFEEIEVRKALWDAHIYGTGFVKTVWNPSLAGGLGDAQSQHVSPFSIYPDPNARSLDDAEWIVEVKHMSLSALDRKFPGAAKRLATASPENIDEHPDQIGARRKNSVNPGSNPGKMSTPGSLRYGPPGAAESISDSLLFWNKGVTVFEAWIREHEVIDLPTGVDPETGPATRKTVREHWRVVVMCNDVILMDKRASHLWSHRGHPYDRVVLADLGEFWGPSLVELLTAPQILLNRLQVSVMQNIELVGNPVLLESSTSGLQRTKAHARPGERLTVNPQAMAQGGVQWMNPPQMHSKVDQMMSYLQSRMEAISGLKAIAKGDVPGGRNAQGTIDAMQEASFVRVRMALRELEAMLQGAGRKKASLIIDNYTQPRTMAVLGKDGERTHLTLRARHFLAANPKGAAPMAYSINVDAGSARDTSRAAQQDKAMTLYTLGAIDELPLLQALDWPKAKETATRVQQLRAQQAMAEPGKRERARAK